MQIIVDKIFILKWLCLWNTTEIAIFFSLESADDVSLSNPKLQSDLKYLKMLDQLHFLLGVQRHIYFESLYAVIIANNYSYTQLKCSNILFAYREDGQPIRNRQLILENSYPITYHSTLHAVDGIWWLVNYSNTFACISRPGNVILVLSTIFMVLIIAGNLEIGAHVWSVLG